MRHEKGMPLQLFVGILLVVGGLWHAAAPWVFGYAANRPAMISNIVAGTALTLVGVGIIWLRGAAWLNWIGAVVGVWVMISPAVLGIGPQWMAMVEANWGGLLAIAVITISALDLLFQHSGGIRDYNETSTAHA
jgi:hypothetical protein